CIATKLSQANGQDLLGLLSTQSSMLGITHKCMPKPIPACFICTTSMLSQSEVGLESNRARATDWAARLNRAEPERWGHATKQAEPSMHGHRVSPTEHAPPLSRAE